MNADEAEANFILGEVAKIKLTKICQEKIKAAIKDYPPLSSKTIGEFIYDHVNKRYDSPNCLRYIRDAIDAWKKQKGLTNSESALVANMGKLGLKNTASASALVREARNLPSAALFTGDINQYTTVEKLDAYIGKAAADKLKTEAETKVEGPVSDTIEDLCIDPDTDFKSDVCSWDRMHSSGALFDCLIHSFLNMVSPNFRKLTDKDKIPIASAFRREFTPRLPEIEHLVEKDEAIARLLGKYVFLTDTELNALARTYRINVIVFEYGRSVTIEGYGRVTGATRMPSAITPLDGFLEVDTFYLLSLKDRHYEAVRTTGGEYTVSRDLMNQIQAEFPSQFQQKTSITDCKYSGTDTDIKDGDSAEYKGKECLVLNRTFDSSNIPKCTSVEIITSDGEVKNVGKNELKFIRRGAAAAANGSGAAAGPKKLPFKNWLKTPDIQMLLNAGVPQRNLQAQYNAMGGAKRSGRTRRHSGKPRSRSLRRRR